MLNAIRSLQIEIQSFRIENYSVLCYNTIQTVVVSLPVQKGDRVAQLILERIFLPELLELDVSGIA